MAPNRTRTIKNKHAAGKSGVAGSKAAKKTQKDGVVKSRKPKGPVVSKQVKGRPNVGAGVRKKKRVYSEKELAIPELNRITPIGVQKPKGKKKGKVFVDDGESMRTILAIVQAEKEGQIESKMIKARQMEEIREARRIEAEKKEAERKAKFDETKESLRKKRKRPSHAKDGQEGQDDADVRTELATGTKASKSKAKSKSRRKVAFADG